jgi:DNA-binding transcriptional MocR family regulator
MRQTISVEPVYVRLANLLEEMIRGRSLRPGDRVPSVRHFSEQQRVSVPTALHAYTTLETRGLIEARPKSGFFVRARLADLVREPDCCAEKPKVSNLANLDPLDSLLSDHSDPKLVPLGVALPSPQLLPTARLGQMMGTLARRMGAAGGSYDVAPGSELLRKEIARRSLEWGCALKTDDLIVTNGATEALSLALRATCQPGDTVLVEAPTYFGLAHMLRELRLKALPIKVESSSGIDLDAVEAALRKKRVTACALISNFNNPTGVLIPDERKKSLVELATQHRVPLIEDDIYGDLQHEGTRPRCLKSYDRDGWVILCGSFSKTLAPGYRVGYIAGSQWQHKILNLKKCTSLANATLPSLAIAEFLKNGGYDRHLRKLRRLFREQVAQMREAIVESFPEGIGLSRPQGSFLLWCELPKSVDAVKLFQQARASGISIAPGPLFSVDGSFTHFIRLNCGYPWDARIERSVGILGDLVSRMSRK